MRKFFVDFAHFCLAWYHFLLKYTKIAFFRFESGKDILVAKLTFGRGRLVRPFVHSGMAALLILGMALAPLLASSPLAGNSLSEVPSPSAVLSAATTEDPQTSTFISEKPRAETLEYTVREGETVSGIAQKFGISVDTIRWTNDLPSVSSIKPGQKLKILPVTGVSHKVKKGETIYSIARHYSSEPQGIVDFPFNVFVNDETFALAVGQVLIVPDGVMPKVTPWAPGVYIARLTPDAGVVSATGIFVWPVSGKITQAFRWYHKGIDIANKEGPLILAADSGKVVAAGWPDGRGYGNKVVIDHGNGFTTLYAHLSRIYVSPGQTVKRGDKVGQMGSTGRSTGVHLHFEIERGGSPVDPLVYLK